MKAVPSSITVEEAVARMVNMDYIPEGMTLIEIMEAFEEVAKCDYENAIIDRLPGDQIKILDIRRNACTTRLVLADLLLESLRYEVKHPENSMIVLDNDSFGHQRLTFDSVLEWAADRYGIGISKWTNTVDEKLKNVSWEEVTIKIWKDHKIGFSIKKGNLKRSHFRKIGLMGDAKKTPNQLGLILIGLSQGKRYPPTKKYCEPNEKTAISKLGGVLKEWIGLLDGPFIAHNQSDGWKPKFKLIYDVKNAEKRAKEKAFHVSLEFLDKQKKRNYDSDDIDETDGGDYTDENFE